jgi:predicted RNA-binding protein with EMAP domain
MATVAPIYFVSDEDKRRFAEVFVRTQNAATAAMSIIANTGEALRQSYILPNDSLVIEEISRIKEKVSETDLLPSKADLAREVLQRARETKDNEEYGKLMELYFKVMGMIEKPGANVDVSVKVASVMVVRDHGTDEEWAAKAARQQRELTADATA